MPIDVTRIPALEYELAQAHGTKPGGQPPNEDRIAAIEEQLAIHRDALDKAERDARKSSKAKPAEGENASNVSTDYSAESKVTRPAKKTRGEVKDEAKADKPETTENKAADEAKERSESGAVETADATTVANEQA